MYTHNYFCPFGRNEILSAISPKKFITSECIICFTAQVSQGDNLRHFDAEKVMIDSLFRALRCPSHAVNGQSNNRGTGPTAPSFSRLWAVSPPHRGTNGK